MTDFIERTGRLAPDILQYHAWPSTWILLATTMEVLGLHDVWPILRIFPLAFQFVLLVMLIFFLRESLGHAKPAVVGPAVTIFFLTNWVGVAAWQPSALGMVLFLAALAWLFRMMRTGHESGTLGILGLLLILALTFSHFLSIAAFVALIVAVWALRRRGSWIIVSLAIAAISAWGFYWAEQFVSVQAGFLKQHIFDLRLLFQLGFSDRVTGMANPVHRWVNLVKVATSGVAVALALGGGLRVFLSRQASEEDRLVVVSLLGILGFALFMGAGYLWELPDRIFLFSLPLMVHFIARLGEPRHLRVFSQLVVWITFPLFFLSTHGNAIVDYYSPEARAGVEFFHQATSTGRILSMSATGLAKNAESYAVSITHDLYPKRPYGTKLSTLADYLSAALSGPCYIELSDYERRLMTYQYGDAEFFDALRNQVESIAARLYDNADVRLYDCRNARNDSLGHVQ